MYKILRQTLKRLNLILAISLMSFHVIAQTNTSITNLKIPDFTECPEIKWMFHTKAPLYSSPVVTDNLVLIGGCDSVLYALDINNGKEKWRFKTRGEIRSNVCLKDAVAYLNGGDGALYAIEKNTGNMIWRFASEGERKYDFADYFHSTPVLFENTVYFGSGDGNLYAVNAESGKLVWRFKTGNIVHTTPVIDNRKIFFGSFDGFVYALSQSDGELIWKFKTVGHRYFPVGEVQGSPAVFSNMVFIGARDYNVYALDQDKGFCHWNKSFTLGWGLCNNIHDSVLYTGSADERILTASDPATGKELWNKKMEFLVFGNNAYSESMMYIGTTIGKLHGINLKTGNKIWSFETESYLQNRTKYFKNDDSYRDDIYSIIKSSEQFLEVEIELGGIFSTPYISEDLLLFSSTNGIVYCLKRKI